MLEMGVQGAYSDRAVQEEWWPGREKPGLKDYSGGATGQNISLVQGKLGRMRSVENTTAPEAWHPAGCLVQPWPLQMTALSPQGKRSEGLSQRARMGRWGTGRALVQMERGPCGGRAQLEEQLTAKDQRPAGGVKPIHESSGLTPPFLSTCTVPTSQNPPFWASLVLVWTVTLLSPVLIYPPSTLPS